MRPEIFTRAIDWPGVARAHLNGDGVPSPPPKKKICENLGYSFRRNSPSAIASRGIWTAEIDFPLGLAAPGGLTSALPRTSSYFQSVNYSCVRSLRCCHK